MAASEWDQLVLEDSVVRFLNVYRTMNADKTSNNTAQAIQLGQDLLQVLPVTSPLFSLCSCCLANCLFTTWEKTNAEEKRDRELLEIIGSRVGSAVNRCLPNDTHRAWYLATQQSYYCIVRNFSARLEDDFRDYEYLNTLNAAVFYAKVAWDNLRNNKAQARHAADNLGNLYMTRYTYLGRTGDLDDALALNTQAVLLTGPMASKFRFQSYTKQATRSSLFSQFEDQPDESDDAIDYMNQVIQGRTWEIENTGVTPDKGSSYPVALEFFSQIHCQAFIRRRRRAPGAEKHLYMAMVYASKAVSGIKEIDPGRLLCFNNAASTGLQVYLGTLAPESLEVTVQLIIFALKLPDALLTGTGISRSRGGIRIMGNSRGNILSDNVVIPSRTPSNNQRLITQRRYQRWVVQSLEISADVLLTRYASARDGKDLAVAIVALRMSIQGTHGWSSRKPKLIFKLYQALLEELRSLNSTDPLRVHNFLRRSSHLPIWIPYVRELRNRSQYNRERDDETFAPLVRSKCTSSVLNMEPVNGYSWQPVAPRGCYIYDMQLSTDAPRTQDSDTVSSAEHNKCLLIRLDLRIDKLLSKLDPGAPETALIWSMWNKLYWRAGASLKRAELYQRALTAFIEKGDLETASELADLATAVLGHLELFLLEPDDYLSELSHASNLAITIACVWLTRGRDPWTSILALENGRELGSRHGMNTVRSYAFDPEQELLPQIDIIRNQLRKQPRADYEDTTAINDKLANKSKDLTRLVKDIVDVGVLAQPFSRQRCMWEARNSYIIHLITSSLGTYALVTSSDEFQKLELRRCTHEQLLTRTSILRKALETCQRHEAQKGMANRELRSMLAWLWKTVAKPIVQFLNLKKQSSNLPRIKWIACGVFSQLPIHAAGIYSKNSSDYVDQYAVSSYLSSIRASMASQQRKPSIPYYRNANRDFTLFGMSTSPQVPEGKLVDLAVTEEKRRICASLGDSFTNNTIDRCNLGVARDMMHWARIVHFTCHGLPHPTDPSKSRLVLLRDAQEPCTVAQIREMDIANPLLLFLSACHSAVDPRASETDEITHLAKAFLLAGFPTVIGTLWQAYQDSALDIAAVFYAQVAQGWKVGQDEPDADVFPRALHRAVCEWRENDNTWKPMDWASWVCFAN
ncbi:hypothetical protein MMC27_008359 [Xylographa pallens]|nr:hypothetical protein [Xylographa pallens]